MPAPDLLVYEAVEEYRRHYLQVLCRTGLTTHDGIHVFFDRHRFDHAFFESSNRDGTKDVFSNVRAQRMDWIKETLCQHNATIYEGWDGIRKAYDPTRRVQVAYEDFVVVIRLRQDRAGELRAKFVTCYKADNSIGKIRTSPLWTREKCLAQLGK